ncbi:PAS domain S-box protein [bacterium]|nr:PAS domain S-box protein [bacterium]
MSKARIIVVEDEVIIAMEIENSLQNLGYEVTSVVNSGDEAIQKSKGDKADLILMDIRIQGDKDGIETAEIIRNKFSIPVVFSTAYLDEERIERAKITMPFGYVLKPIQERDLKVTLEMALYVAKIDAERRKAELALRKSEERFSLAMDATSDGLFDWNIKTNEIYFSPGYFSMLGYDANELPHTFETYQTLLHPEDAVRTEINLTNYLSGKISDNSIEIRLKGKSGKWIWILSRGNIVELDENGNPSRMVGTNVNIDDRKRAEEQLLYEKELTNHYLNVAGVLLIALDLTGNVTLINPKGCEILGYPEDEIIGYNWFDKFLPSEGIDEVKKVFYEIVEGNIEPVEYYENPISRKDGSQRYIAWHNSILRNKQGEIIGLFSSGEDRTQQHRTEVFLKENEKKYRALFENAPYGIFLVDHKARYKDVNDIACKMTGYSREELLQLTIPEISSPDEEIRKQDIKPFLDIQATGKGEGVIHLKHKDGYIFKAELKGVRIDENTIMGICEKFAE